MRTVLSYRRRRGPLQDASPWAAIAFLGSFGLVALLCSNPIVLLGAGAAVVVAGLAAGAGPALALAARFGLTLGLAIVVVNVLVTTRGETILVRGWDLPVLGETGITLESIAAGGVLALRILVIVAASAVYSACVDPDRVLRLVRPFARHSALTATLIARLVPLAAHDLARLREAGKLRGPAAAPATRAALARRLLTGALDRAVDSAATLELRGYATAGRTRPAPRPRSRQDRWFALAALAVVAGFVAVALSGGAGFEPYPAIRMDAGPATIALAAALPALAALPFAFARRGTARRRAPAAMPRAEVSRA
jgi:energy-coupling factor transport system permease protein